MQRYCAVVIVVLGHSDVCVSRKSMTYREQPEKHDFFHWGGGEVRGGVVVVCKASPD